MFDNDTLTVMESLSGGLMWQVFARKVIRPFGAVTEWDLQNEVRILKKIENHKHPHIIRILKHGSLEGSQYYHVDMELCQLNLAQYIYKKGEWPDIVKQGRYFIATEGHMGHIWEIVKEIALGLAFLHKIGEVHRDLKPENSNIFICG